MPEPLLQRWALGLALGFTVFGIVRVGLFPIDAPQAHPIDPALLNQLEEQGWKVHATVAPQGRLQVSNAKGVVLFQPDSVNRKEVQLSLVPIRARAADQLDAENIGREISGQSPKKGRSLKVEGKLLFFFQDGKQRQLASSCIASGQASSKSDEVERAIGNPSVSWRNRVETSLGLRPLRDWSCLFIMISTPNSSHNLAKYDPDQVISRVWSDVLPILTKRPALPQ
jgi:hypothetical protein